VAGISVWWIANGLVAEGRMMPFIIQADVPQEFVDDLAPTMPLIAPVGWTLIVLLSIAGFVGWVLGAARAFYASGTVTYILLVFWSENVWKEVRQGDLLLAGPGGGLLLTQVVAGLLLLSALVMAYLFRPSHEGTALRHRLASVRAPAARESPESGRVSAQ
jgi:hypothetical protein